MLVREILSESDYMDDLKSFVVDLLVAYRSNDLTKVDFEKFLQNLRKAGFVTIDQEYLVDLLDQQEIVDNVDPSQNVIILSSGDLRPDAEVDDDVDKNAEKVSDMAGKEAMKAVSQ